MTGAAAESTSSLVMHEVREIETWILRLLSAPVPVPGKTRVEVCNIQSSKYYVFKFCFSRKFKLGMFYVQLV
jgi:hypothetical protein